MAVSSYDMSARGGRKRAGSYYPGMPTWDPLSRPSMTVRFSTFIGKPWNEQELKNAVRDGVEKHRSLANLKRVADESLTIAADLLQQGFDKREETYNRNQELESEVTLLKKYESCVSSA